MNPTSFFWGFPAFWLSEWPVSAFLAFWCVPFSRFSGSGRFEPCPNLHKQNRDSAYVNLTKRADSETGAWHPVRGRLFPSRISALSALGNDRKRSDGRKPAFSLRDLGLDLDYVHHTDRHTPIVLVLSDEVVPSGCSCACLAA